MISFKQFLIENRFLEKIHENPSIDTIKNISTKSKFKESRFAITRENKLYVGSADNFVHNDLSNDPSSHVIEGFINHDYKGANERVGPVKGMSYIAFHATNEDSNPSHPILDRLKKAGIHDRAIPGFHYTDKSREEK